MDVTRHAAERALVTAERLAEKQERIVTRRQLYAAGVPRWLVQRELRQRRWRVTGRQTVATHNGPLPVQARRWVAVLELGPRAALSGVSALQHAGIDALKDEEVHVIAPRGLERRRLAGVVLHESRRFRESDVLTVGLRRTRPAVSAVFAALWARTERQAAYLVTLAVQQRLCTADQLGEVLDTVKRHRFRRVLRQTVADLRDGVRSVGELDVARAMRSRGLPEPERQSVRLRPDGKEYLDADFPAYQVSLEVDGQQHDLPEARLADLLRDITLAAEGRSVVRIPLVAWRLDQERVLDALERLFFARGWRRLAS